MNYRPPIRHTLNETNVDGAKIPVNFAHRKHEACPSPASSRKSATVLDFVLIPTLTDRDSL